MTNSFENRSLKLLLIPILLFVLLFTLLTPPMTAFADEEEDDEGVELEGNYVYANMLYLEAGPKGSSEFPYYDADVKGNSSAMSVESIVNIYTGWIEGGLTFGEGKLEEMKKNPAERQGGAGYDYAVFLHTLNDWNLYRSQSNIMESSLASNMTWLKALLGLPVLLGIIAGKILDFTVNIVVQFLDVFNIFNYFNVSLEDGVETDNNALVTALRPIIEVYNGFGTIVKAAIFLVFAWVIFLTVSGAGKAAGNRSGYFKSGMGRIFMMFFAIVGVPLMLGGIIGAFKDTLESTNDEDGVVSSMTDNVVQHYMVSTQSWIHGSILLNLEAEGEDAVDERVGKYGLIKPGGFPETRDEVLDNYPRTAVVANLNNPGGVFDGANDLNMNNEVTSTRMITSWILGETFRPSELNATYGLYDVPASEDEDAKWYAKLGSNIGAAFSDMTKTKRGEAEKEAEDRSVLDQYKLSPKNSGVLVVGKSKLLSASYDEVQINKTLLAGNGLLDKTMNGAEMFALIWGIVIVASVILFSMLASIIKSVVLITTNTIMSATGSVQGLVGALTATLMLFITVMTGLLTISIYANVAKGMPDALADTLVALFDKESMVTNFISSFTAILINILGAYIAIKSRHAVITAVENFFNRMLLNLNLVKRSDGRATPAMDAVGQISDNARSGWSAPERAGSIFGAMQDERAGMKDELAQAEKEGYDEAYSKSLAGMQDDDSLTDAEKKERADEAGRTGASEARKQAKADIKARDGGKFKRYGRAGMAGATAALEDIAENSPNKGDGKNRMFKDTGGYLAGKGAAALNRMAGLNSTGDMSQMLDDQANSSADLQDAVDDKNEKQKRVAELTAERERMANDPDVSAHELELKDQELSDARNQLEVSASRLGEATDRMVESGELSEEIGESQRQGNELMTDATSRAEEATSAIASIDEENENLQSTRENLAANGASEEELQSIDDRIEANNAEKRGLESELRQANRDIKTASDLMDSGIVDSNNVIASAEDRDMAEERLEQAMQTQHEMEENGGLDAKDNESIVRFAKQNASATSGFVKDSEAELNDAKDAMEARDHIDSRDGKAFNDEDVKQAEAQVKSAQNKVNAESDKLKSLEASGASTEAINSQREALANAEDDLADAQRQHSTMKQISEGNFSGNDGEAIKQEQAVQHAENEFAKASEQADKARQNVQDVKAKFNNGEATEEDVANAQRAHQSAMKEVSNASQNLDNAKMARADKQEEASRGVESAQQAVNDETRKLDSMKASKVSEKALANAQESVTQSTGAYQNAQTELSSMKAEGVSDAQFENQAGRYTDAKASLANEEAKLEELKSSGASAGRIEAQSKAVDVARGRANSAKRNLQNLTDKEVSFGAVSEQADNVATAKSNLRNAENNLNELKSSGATPSEIEAQEQVVQNAQNTLNNRRASLNAQQGIVQNEAQQVDDARSNYQNAVQSLNNLETRQARGEAVSDSAIKQATQRVTDARNSYDSAVGSYNNSIENAVKGGAVTSQMVNDQASRLNTLKSNRSDAQGRVEYLQERLSAGDSSVTTEDVKRAQGNVTRLDSEIARGQSYYNGIKAQQLMSSGSGIASRESAQQNLTRAAQRHNDMQALNDTLTRASKGEATSREALPAINRANKAIEANAKDSLNVAKANQQTAQTKLAKLQSMRDSGEPVSARRIQDAQRSVDRATETVTQQEAVLNSVQSQNSSVNRISRRQANNIKTAKDNVATATRDYNAKQQNYASTVTSRGIDKGIADGISERVHQEREAFRENPTDKFTQLKRGRMEKMQKAHDEIQQKTQEARQRVTQLSYYGRIRDNRSVMDGFQDMDSHGRYNRRGHRRRY